MQKSGWHSLVLCKCCQQCGELFRGVGVRIRFWVFFLLFSNYLLNVCLISVSYCSMQEGFEGVCNIMVLIF